MITITENEYLTYTGVSLAIELDGLDDNGNKVNRFITLITNRVYDKISKPIPETLTAFQEQSIKRAICEYGAYYLKNGDLTRLSGYDEDKGLTIDPMIKQSIAFPQESLDILRRAGLIKRSIGHSNNIYGGYYG